MAGYLAGCASIAQQPGRVTEVDAPREREASRSPEPTVRIPSEDAPGHDLSDLPRYPGSVRVEYSRAQRDGLETVRARYLTRDGLDVVRGYYRGVFRAEEWEVGNAEFYDDEWTFLVLHGAREAEIEIEAHEGDVTGTDIRLTEPVPAKRTSKETARETGPPQEPRTATSRGTPAPRPATPAPQPSSPAPHTASPAPGYYGDDFGEEDD